MCRLTACALAQVRLDHASIRCHRAMYLAAAAVKQLAPVPGLIAGRISLRPWRAQAPSAEGARLSTESPASAAPSDPRSPAIATQRSAGVTTELAALACAISALGVALAAYAAATAAAIVASLGASLAATTTLTTRALPLPEHYSIPFVGKSLGRALLGSQYSRMPRTSRCSRGGRRRRLRLSLKAMAARLQKLLQQ